METNVSNPAVSSLVTHDVRSFMKSKGFVSVHKAVRENTNGYPYITFINGNNEAENIYFSKAASEVYGKDMAIERGFFDKLVVAETTNADGELRYKLAIESGNRLSVDDLF